MNILKKMKLVNSIFDIFLIKTGKIIKYDKKSYQVSNWIAIIFKFYYRSTIPLFIIFFSFLLTPHFFENLILQLMEIIVLYTLFEYLILIIIPINEVSQFKDLKKEIDMRKYGNY